MSGVKRRRRRVKSVKCTTCGRFRHRADMLPTEIYRDYRVGALWREVLRALWYSCPHCLGDEK